MTTTVKSAPGESFMLTGNFRIQKRGLKRGVAARIADAANVHYLRSMGFRKRYMNLICI
jgi:hypothetical protein